VKKGEIAGFTGIDSELDGRAGFMNGFRHKLTGISPAM